MRIFNRRRSTAGAVLMSAAATALFVLPAAPASAGTATVSNACANSVTANFSQIEVTTSGSDGVATVAPGGALTSSGLSQQAAIPGSIFVAGYNLGLLTVGSNNIPANVQTTIEATNTTQGTQTTNQVGGSPPNGSVTVTTVITDPDGVPGTLDESATDASFSVSYNDQLWTAGASGTINYRQESIAVAPPTTANQTLLINALIAGFLNVQFRCAPGTVTGLPPGVITLTDPAASFDTTDIITGPVNQAPTANAGTDQTVASNANVNLDGTGSSDPDVGDTLTYSWTQTSGTSVTLSGANTATPSFTAPTGPATLVFQVEVCDQNLACTTDTVTVTVEAVAAVADGALDVIVSGPTASTKTSKTVVAKVCNVGTTPITVSDTDVVWDIEVSGTNTTGSVSPLNAGSKTLGPGSCTRFRFSWTYGTGEVTTGATVDYSATLSVTGDAVLGNNTDTETRTAK